MRPASRGERQPRSFGHAIGPSSGRTSASAPGSRSRRRSVMAGWLSGQARALIEQGTSSGEGMCPESTARSLSAGPGGSVRCRSGPKQRALLQRQHDPLREAHRRGDRCRHPIPGNGHASRATGGDSDRIHRLRPATPDRIGHPDGRRGRLRCGHVRPAPGRHPDALVVASDSKRRPQIAEADLRVGRPQTGATHLDRPETGTRGGGYRGCRLVVTTASSRQPATALRGRRR